MTEAPSPPRVDGGGRPPSLHGSEPWGLVLRVTGPRVEATVPDWLRDARATHAAIDQVRDIAAELSRRPDEYGFDPDAAYTLFFQTWDRALCGSRSVAFGRDIVGQAAVGLLPDVYYGDTFGFRALHDAAADAPRWEHRRDMVAWRGSVTGVGPYTAAGQIPRLRLARLCRDMAGVDVKLIGIHPTMSGVFPPDDISAYVRRHRLDGERWPQADFGRCKFVIDIDGHANAWGFLEKLILGCCVLKVASPYAQWFYHRLDPWIHFVPVRADLSDLGERIAWCRDNMARCAWIAGNAARLAQTLTLERQLPDSCHTLIEAADRAPPAPGRRAPPDAPPVQCVDRIRESAILWHSLGRLAEAVADYTRLIDAGLGGTELLLRRSALHAEQGRFALAAADVDRAMPGVPEDLAALPQVARFMMGIGRDATAVALLRGAPGPFPDGGELAVDLAGGCLRLGWLDVGYWAVRDLPDGLPHGRADVRRLSMEHYAAQRTGTMAVLRGRRTGDFTEAAWMDLAFKLYSLGRLGPARRLCDQLAARMPELFMPLDLASRIIWRRHGPAAAVRYLRALPGEVRALDDHAMTLAQRLHDLARHEEVLRAVAGRPATERHPQVRYIVAVAYLLLGRSADLRAHCRDWIADEPTAAVPARMMCSAYPLAGAAGRAEGSAGPITVASFSDAAPGRDAADDSDSWAERHPGICRRRYDDASARAYLLAEYGREAVDAFAFCGASRGAFLGFAWLHRTGGVWVDADQTCVAPMASMLSAAICCELSAVRVGGSVLGHVDGMFLGTRRGSTLAARLFSEAEAAVRDARTAGRPGLAPDAIGAGLITRTIGTHLATAGEAGADLFLIALPHYQRHVRRG